MDFETRLRALLVEATTSGLKLSYHQLEKMTGVPRRRLWSFATEGECGCLFANQAQRVYEKLSGKPLFQDGGEA